MRALEPGPAVVADVFTGGGQLSLQHRQPIYAGANDLTTKLTVLGSVPYGDVGVSMDLRLLFFSFGAQVGLRADWHNYNFDPAVIEAQSPEGPSHVQAHCPTEPHPDDPGRRVPTGERCDASRNARIKMLDRDLTTGLALVPYGELRAQLFAPLNDYVFFSSLIGFEYQGRENDTFDNVYSLRHDRGWLTRWETQLFLRHRDVGAIGALARVIRAPLGEGHRTEFTYGFLALRRLGLLRRNDAIALWAMFQPGNPDFGIQQFRAPIWAILAYRVEMNL